MGDIKIGDKLEYFGYSVSCEAEIERYEKGLCPVVNSERQLKIGEIYTVVGKSNYSDLEGKYGDLQGIGVNGDQISVHGCSFSNFRKVNNKNNMNTIKNTIKNLLRGEPEKSFVKAGFLDDQENMTAKGQEALLFVLWEKSKTELKELADKINAEDSK